MGGGPESQNDFSGPKMTFLVPNDEGGTDPQRVPILGTGSLF